MPAMRAARREAILICVALALCGVAAPAAPAAPAWLTALRQAHLHQRTYIRGFFAEDDLHYDSSGAPLKRYRTTSWTVSQLEIEDIGLRKNDLVISADRLGLLFNADAHKVSAVRLHLIRLDVRLGPAAMSDARAQQLWNALFIPAGPELTAAVPDYWRPFLESPSNSKPAAPPRKSPPLKPGMIAPHAVHAPDPKYNDLARELRISGSIIFAVTIEPNGSVDQIKIVQPMGLGMDDAAVDTLRQWRFRPATKDGVPVAWSAWVKINFHLEH